MFSRLRSRLAYANIVSSLSLFLVLTGGTAFALTGSNTVFSDDITNGQVKNGDVAANAVGGGKVIDNSLGGADVTNLQSRDVADNSLTGADIATGTIGGDKVGDGSLAGRDLAGGSIGTREITDISNNWQQASTSVPANGGVGEVIAQCPSGHKVLGGGAQFAFPSGEVSKTRPVKTEEGEGWSAGGQNNGGVAQALLAWAICLPPAE
jgi:hypothetical protein